MTRRAAPSLPSCCPTCGAIGPSARPCQQPACLRLGSHHIPARFCPLPGEALDARIGRMLGGKYLLLDVVGEGGAGRVYLAAQQPIGLKAAVKVLRGTHDALASPERLRDEARALAEVDHPAVIRLLDFGEDAHAVWLVTEYVDGGRTLADALADGLELDERHRLLGEVARGLAAAHAHGLVHRDVKPGNVLLQAVAGQGPAARLVDFGLAKFIDEGDHTEVVAGTLRYMAPEQALRRDIGPWTDWYAFGVMMCEAVSGRRPLDDMSPIEGLRRRCGAAFDPVAALGVSVGPVTARVVRRMLARRPSERPATLDEIVSGLDAVVAERRASLSAPAAGRPPLGGARTTAERPPPSGAASRPAPAPASPVDDASSPPATGRGLRWRRPAVAMAGILALGWLVTRGGPQAASAPADGRVTGFEPSLLVERVEPPTPPELAEPPASPPAARAAVDRAGPRLDFEVIDLDALQRAHPVTPPAAPPRARRRAARGRLGQASPPAEAEPLTEEALEAAGRAFLQ